MTPKGNKKYESCPVEPSWSDWSGSGSSKLAKLRDQLTRLAGPRLVTRHISKLGHETGAGAMGIAVFRLTLDRFDRIFACVGSAMCEQMRSALAERIWDSVLAREITDTATYVDIASVGSDDFVIVVGGIESDEAALAAGYRLRECAGKSLPIGGSNYFLDAIVGVAVGNDSDPSDRDLLRDAGTALVTALSSETTHVMLFDPGMREKNRNLLELEQDLRCAVAGGELRVVYQPMVCLSTGEIDGFEALVRWDHPSRGRVLPMDFIPLAEETGLIIPIGEYVFAEACRELGRIDLDLQSESDDRSLSMSVNVSKRQLAEPGFLATFQRILAETGIEPSRIRLEVTESAVMENVESVAALLVELKQLGLRIAMDDFGVGYSSLSCLQQFPLDYLKIDRSFISNVTRSRKHAAVVQAVVALARDLGMSVVAEGIESQEQATFLQSIDCNLAQGFLFAKPLDPNEVRAFLRRRIGAVGDECWQDAPDGAQSQAA